MKKFVSFMLLLCLLLSTFGSVNAQEASVTIKDKTRSYLLGLEVLEEKDLENLSEPMARKDAVKLVINLLGVDVLVASNTVSTFADVPNDSEYVPYIETARQLGLVQGDYSGNFRPDENITIDQYACILVRALGYTGAAESHGGFMTGYNALVNHLRLLKGITPGGNVKANFYIMTENALKENLRSELANGDAIENETLLESIMNRKDLITGEGIVYGNEVYPLDSTVTTDEEQVKIGDSILFKGKMDIEGLLGQKVRYFAKESGGGYEVTSAFTENFNKTLCITGKDIAGFDAGTLSYYDEDNDKNKVSIDTITHYYLVNNRPAASLTLSDLTGKITLIDNDKDNTYEVVSVENSTTHKIIEINSKLGQVSLQKEDWYTAGDLLAVSDLIDEDDDREVVILNAVGEKTDFSALKVGDVIDICFSADKKYIRISVNENIVDGKISMIEDDKTLTIGDKEYDISASSKGIPAFDNSYLNSEGVFYLNHNGEISYYKESENTKKYAYIANIGGKSNGISNKVQVKFVFPGGIKYYEKTYEDGTTEKYLNASNDSVMIFDFAKKVKVDGNRRDCKDMPSLLSIGDIVEYRLNSDGEINEIKTPVSYYDGDTKSHYRKFTVFNDASATEEKDKKVFSFSGVNKGGFRVTSEDTAVFCVPPFDDERYTVTGDASYSLSSDDDYMDRVRMNNGTQYYTRAYEFDEEDGIAYVFAIVSGLNANRTDDVLNSESWSILTGKKAVLDENGDWVYKLTGYTDGKPFEIMSQSGDIGGFGRAIDDLRIGDVFKYTLNTQERIYSISEREDIFSITADIDNYDSGFYSRIGGNIYGSVADIKRKFIHESTGMYASRLTVEYGEGVQYVNVPHADNGIYYYDMETKEITVASQNQIYSSLETGSDASWVFAKLDSALNAEIVVIVNK